MTRKEKSVEEVSGAEPEEIEVHGVKERKTVNSRSKITKLSKSNHHDEKHYEEKDAKVFLVYCEFNFSHGIAFCLKKMFSLFREYF